MIAPIVLTDYRPRLDLHDRKPNPFIGYKKLSDRQRSRRSLRKWQPRAQTLPRRRGGVADSIIFCPVCNPLCFFPSDGTVAISLECFVRFELYYS